MLKPAGAPFWLETPAGTANSSSPCVRRAFIAGLLVQRAGRSAAMSFFMRVQRKPDATVSGRARGAARIRFTAPLRWSRVLHDPFNRMAMNPSTSSPSRVNSARRRARFAAPSVNPRDSRQRPSPMRSASGALNNNCVTARTLPLRSMKPGTVLRAACTSAATLSSG